MSDDWTEADDIIEEVREIRRQISARFDHDPAKLGAYLRRLEKEYEGPFIELPDPVKRSRPTA